MRVADLLKMIAEILNLKNDSVKFIEEEYSGHYVRTPYAYQPKLGRKYIPSVHVDLGQGLLQVITDLDNSET
jgi:UDP-glucose 4-epimerase